MTALPRQHELDLHINHLPLVDRAYSMILQFEQSAKSDKELVHARILGYLIIHGPSDDARETVAREVDSCHGDETKLGNLGQFYVEHYIRGFKKYKGRTPTPSSHPSRHSFDILKDAVSSEITEPATQHRVAKRKALRRDNFRCVITGAVDDASAERDPELRQTALLLGVTVTHCAHIFPESTNMNISGDGNNKVQRDYAASMWAVMTRFGYGDLPQKLNGSNIHSLENILTLDGNMHEYFDTLKLWFEPTDIPDKYNICWSEDWRRQVSGALSVQFTTPDPEELPLPSPTYLHIHAACAKVAKLSGAGDYIDKLSRDLEEIRVLSKDGSSAELLKHVLLPLSSEIRVF
ncbi:hypothetical protein BU15DRAFT_87516 [Melanogaster broomeanus]|nr:hypothetical protein BU15DRAFT_87516 [Melanogaster broomeanus]